MLLKSEDKQFKLADDGQVLWQQDATNPLPGAPVGRIKKGDLLLKPRVDVNDSNLLDGQDKNAIQEKLQDWLDRHVHFSLEPLFRLVGGDDFTAQARGIAFQLQQALGILPRESVEDLIGGLDEEGRKALRARKVRMGPLLIFLPELNKPAAIRLRAILLSLWQGRELPAELPRDGMVSFTIDPQTVDADYYRAIGYPVYGPRAIRVDMLDRVVCAVYDAAKDGKFQAQHKMAEWLGSNILDLYAVLDAMGHKMTHDPASEKAAAPAPAVSPSLEAMEAIAPVESDAPAEAPEEDAVSSSMEVPAVEEVPGGGPTMDAMPTQEQPAGDAPAEKAAAVKPELATFRLKRGKANEAAQPRERAPREKKNFSKADKKPFNKDGKKEGGRPESRDGKKPFKKKDGRPQRDDRNDDRGERVYSSAPSTVADSPFAILQQLKLGNEKKS